MTKKQHKSPRQTFWIFLVIAALIVSLFYWYTSTGPQADELAGSSATTDTSGDGTSDTSGVPACATNFILAIDTTTTMREKLGTDTRLKASVAAAQAFLTHIDAVNAKNPEGVRAKVGLTTFTGPTNFSLSDNLEPIRDHLLTLTPKGANDDGNTLSHALQTADELVRTSNAKPARGTAYIIVISAARNNEDDENDERTATQTANTIKEKNVLIEGFGFKLDGESSSTGKFSEGTPENIVPNITSGDARYHNITTTTGGVSAMNTFAEKTCSKSPTAPPQVASCSSNLDVAYMVENSTEFKNNANRVDLAEQIVTKAQAKLHAPDDRAAALTFSYPNPTQANIVKQGFTTDTGKALAAVKDLKYTGNSNLNQGIGQGNKYIRAHQMLEDGKIRPTAAIVLTTTASNLTQTGIDAAKRDFENRGIRYFVVQIGPADANHLTKMEKLATSAGGQAFDLRPGGTNAEQAEKAQNTVNAIFTKIDALVADCVDITLSVDKNNIKEGQTTNASFIVSNTSRSKLEGAKITQPLPNGLRELVSGAAATATSVTRTIDVLLPGDSIMKTVTLIATN